MFEKYKLYPIYTKRLKFKSKLQLSVRKRILTSRSMLQYIKGQYPITRKWKAAQQQMCGLSFQGPSIPNN